MACPALSLCDDQNPFECSIDATAFINSLRQRTPLERANDHELRSSFTSRLLEKSWDEDDQFRFLLDSLSRYSYQSPPLTIKSAYAVSLWEQNDRCVQSPSRFTSGHQDTLITYGSRKRKRNASEDTTFNDLMGPTKRERSDDSVNYDSFELSGKAEKLRYSHPVFPFSDFVYPPESAPDNTDNLVERIQELEVGFYGTRIGAETPHSIRILTEHLDFLLPGIRLQETLNSMKGLSHQKIADLLAVNGHLSGRILEVFRASEIRFLDLSASMIDSAGLNLGSRDLLRVFSKPNSFLFVSAITIDNTPIKDFDLTHIHHLPQLSMLSLCNTGLGNEAIYHLVRLKWRLRKLYINSNPRIDDDAIAPLLLLSKLVYLTIFGTRVSITGLRRLALELHEAQRHFRVEVSESCYCYVDNLENFYMADIHPPFIDDQSVCKHLSSSDLKHNLSEHAKFNSKISSVGSKTEMATRLQEILTTRKLDLLVASLLAGDFWTEDIQEDG